MNHLDLILVTLATISTASLAVGALVLIDICAHLRRIAESKK